MPRQAYGQSDQAIYQAVPDKEVSAIWRPEEIIVSSSFRLANGRYARAGREGRLTEHIPQEHLQLKSRRWQ